MILALLLVGCQEYEYAVYEQVDVFHQNPPPEVDLLLVIDNSGSMGGYQLLVAARFDELREWLVEAEVDYQIGVVTTTLVRPSFPPNEFCDDSEVAAIPEPGHLHLDTIITPDTPDPQDAFATLVNVNICGNPDEQGLEAARLALSPDMIGPGGPNEGFVRDDASLSVLFVSDEQDQSRGPVAHYLAAMYGVKDSRSRDVFNASALVITDADDCILPVAGSSAGSRYVAMAEMTDGTSANLCNTNFVEAMTEVSRVASRLRDTFVLTQEPNPKTFEVVVEDDPVACDEGVWTYTRIVVDGVEVPAIVFQREALPGPGDQVVVRYDLGTGDVADFCTEPSP